MNFLENLKEKVFCCVGVSKIHGVGVIAIRDIPSGINPFQIEGEESFYVVSGKDMRTAFIAMPDEVRELVLAMCPERKEDDEWDVPARGLNSIGVAWYLNHSDTPNMREEDGDFYALRDIKKGEELTVDYSTYGALNL